MLGTRNVEIADRSCRYCTGLYCKYLPTSPEPRMGYAAVLQWDSTLGSTQYLSQNSQVPTEGT